ncbi:MULTISPECIES: DNA polymerase III subunit gamma/tau [Alteromonadaceae]|uniref:DNA-directed DNA polymerase n=1 Tax=Brumicola blandensis TaxID=3075611 RepID=A0AAW8QUZ7_9ALTE|nr:MULTISPECIES: DNA polymerase III subunit gamma/tau [unclassified Alteromonas]MDT0580917.1 DNA polymerase III subunit gamma/tau [Alteromonas sp. W409]MDT0629654.1 DNA polymerase III subunit gamma/tau [Alteromonas sp. W364]
MSYQVLARKWRPQKFAELVGQEHVVSAISNALDNDKLHHAYLFTGTRGVGKTTIARIFSKSLNCETGQSATPCGTCNACTDIDEGRFVDLLEIDAASRTKVEDTRELLDNVQYKPTRGRFKVYLIDEVHMLSKHSFNALLKTLEEPPPHVKFLLATTDPQKLPVTILSRCLQFSLKALSREQIQTQLEHILKQESIPSEASALGHLARAAQGSMRDALSLTDQAIAQGNNQVTLATVTEMLGLLDKNQVMRLVKAVIEKNSTQAMHELDDICVHAPDYSQVLAELLSLLHQVSLTQIVPDICKIETLSARAVYQLSKSVTAEHIQLLYQIVLQGKKDLPFAPDPFSGLQMTVLRMLAFSPASKVELDLEAGHAQAQAEKKTLELSSDAKPRNESDSKADESDDASESPQLAEPAKLDETPALVQPVNSVESSPVVVQSPPNDPLVIAKDIAQDEGLATGDSKNKTDVSHEPELDKTTQQPKQSEAAMQPDSIEHTHSQHADATDDNYQHDMMNMSFMDDEAESSMFSEYDELASDAKLQRDAAQQLISQDSISTDSGADQLSTTSDLLALADQLDNEEPEDEDVKEERGEATTSSLFDRLMNQENTVFNGDADLPTQNKQSAEQSQEEKPYRNPLEPEAAVEDKSLEVAEPRLQEDKSSETPPWETQELTQDKEEVIRTEEVDTEDEIDLSSYDEDMPFSNDEELSSEGASTLIDSNIDVQAESPQDTEVQTHKDVQSDTTSEQNVFPETKALDPAMEIAAMFQDEFLDLSKVEVTHPKVAPYLEDGNKLLQAKQINKWSDFIEELGVGGLNKQLLLQSNLIEHGDKFVIRIAERNKHLDEEQHRTTITEALSTFYKKPIEFVVEYGEVSETPFQIQQQISLVRHNHAHNVVETNDSIQELIKAFEGQIVEDSIKPR